MRNLTNIAIAVALSAAVAAPSAFALRPGELEMLRKIEAEESARLERRNDAYQRDVENHLTFNQRMEIKRLERKKRELLDKMGNNASLGSGWAYGEEIRAIDNEMARIRRGSN